MVLGQASPPTPAPTSCVPSPWTRDSYNSGIRFNRIDWPMQSNEFGMGLPVAASTRTTGI